MTQRPRAWRIVATGGLAAAALLSAAAASTVRAGAATRVPDPAYFVALGGSGSVGFQPTSARPDGEPTDAGYANDLLEAERAARWSDLALVHFGCPGETTATMLNGADKCHVDGASLLSDVVSFLRSHPTTVLLTIDLGFNDIRPCLRFDAVDASCVTGALATVQSQLATIVTAVRAAAPPGMRLVGVGHYDPYLAASLRGPAGQQFAARSLNVLTRLNDVMEDAYSAAGVPMADVASAFDMASSRPTDDPGIGTVPRNVAQTCRLTWMCAAAPLGPNTHPNDEGYRAIAAAIRAALDRSEPTAISPS
jgi:lysophospholipase L1-like esterase